MKWRDANWFTNHKHEELWAKVKDQQLIKDVINECKPLTNSYLRDYNNKFWHSNKETVI